MKTSDDKAANIRAALEAHAGQRIDASAEQIEELIRVTPYPFSCYSFTPPDPSTQGENVGKVVSKTILVVQPVSCNQQDILDVGGFVRVPDSGHATFRINAFLCPSDTAIKRDLFYLEPGVVVATPESATPVYLTLTHTFIRDPGYSFPTDLQIDIFCLGPEWRAG